jgi:DNA-binding CsgD family transcriptional regulator
MQRPLVGPAPRTHDSEIGCHGTFFLSRTDLEALDRYAQEFGELIVRFLKIVFLSILRSQNDVGAREAIGLRMAQNYLQAFEALEGTSTSSPSRAAGRKLIAALWRMGGSSAATVCILCAFSRLTHGVVLVDRSGLPVWLNRRAREIIDRTNVLQLAACGRLAGRRPSDTRSLRELIKGAVSAGTQGLLAISRSDGLRPLLLVAIPLRPAVSLDASGQFASAVLFISDPDWTDNPTVESLRAAFELTYREAQIAIAIADGHGLQAAADTMGVALTTARSQLQQTFAKTGTRHQAELAALVHRTLTYLRQD